MKPGCPNPRDLRRLLRRPGVWLKQGRRALLHPLAHSARPVLQLPRSVKRAIALLVDTSLCVLCTWLAFYLRLGDWVPLVGPPGWAALASIVIALPIFLYFGFYRAIFRYAGGPVFVTLMQASLLYSLFYALLFTQIGVAGIPRTIGLIQPLLLLLLVAFSRVLARFWLGSLARQPRRAQTRALIYGAGEAGRQLAAAMTDNPDMRVFGFLDDDARLHGQLLNGHPVFDPGKLVSIAERFGISDVLLAMPTIRRERRNAIIATMREAHVAVRTLPSVSQLARGRVGLGDLHELELDDLLGRIPVSPDPALLAHCITGKVVLVTGAGGSIGSELCRQIIRHAPHTLLLVEQSEYALYAIHQSLSHLAAHPRTAAAHVDAAYTTLRTSAEVSLADAGLAGGGTPGSGDASPAPSEAAVGAGEARELEREMVCEIAREAEPALERTREPSLQLIPLLASVCDVARMHEIFSAWRPDTIYHAAAYKHVPLVEHNPGEGLRNNVWGTLTVARAAMAHGAKDFVLISTDKAVRPTNLMGASKRLAEMVLQALADSTSASETKHTRAASHNAPVPRFSMVRFGNVLGSSGSVVPLFRQQIGQGGPITLTHAEVTRYFMSIPEAAQLVLQAGAMAQGGDVFVLDMGEPVKIIDLARRMVELSGHTVRDAAHPGGKIAIQITGLRPGEKLYEELLIGHDPRPTTHPRIMKAHEHFLCWPQLETHLARLEDALTRQDAAVLRAEVLACVPDYQAGALVDWVALQAQRTRDTRASGTAQGTRDKLDTLAKPEI